LDTCPRRKQIVAVLEERGHPEVVEKLKQLRGEIGEQFFFSNLKNLPKF
jgi:hypothetical protein